MFCLGLSLGSLAPALCATGENQPRPADPIHFNATALHSLLASASGGEGLNFDASAVRLSPGDVGLDGLRPAAPASFGLLGRYRKALERESLRRRSRDPAQSWMNDVDEEEMPAPDARREAGRLFKGAGHRVLSQALDRVLEESATLRNARIYAEGVSFDVRRGGGVQFGAGRKAEPTSDIAARFSLIVGSNPRVEMRSTLPGGIKTRMELTLGNPGVSASFSRRLSSRLNGTLAGGYEDGGDDRWYSAGLGVSF